MGTNFAVGDKVKILEGNILTGKTGKIIKDGGSPHLGFRKPGEAIPKADIQQWVVMLDDTGAVENLPEGSLEKIG